MIVHIVARLRPLPAPAVERLWTLLCAGLPDVLAATLMPDHLHVLGSESTHRTLGHMIRAHHREAIARWDPLSAPHPIEGAQHLERGVRYVFDQAPRAELVADPLEWPWSTYHDALGLTLAPSTPPVAVAALFRRPPTPVELHAYVSADPSVHVNGTPFPATKTPRGCHDAMANIDAAVRLVARWSPRTEQRRLIVHAATARGHRQGTIASHLGAHVRTVQRQLATRVPASTVQRVLLPLGDGRLLSAGRRLIAPSARLARTG